MRKQPGRFMSTSYSERTRSTGCPPFSGMFKTVPLHPYLHLGCSTFRGEIKKNSTTFASFDILRANVKLLRQTLSRARGLRNVEVSWRNYFNHDLARPRCRSLEPLNQLPITCKLSIGSVEITPERSNKDLAYWPDKLKGFRVMLFRGGYGENIRIQWRE